MQRQGYGYYETFPRDLLPKLYIAYRTELSEGSEIVHNNLRQRFDAGDKIVIEAMTRFAELTSSAYESLKNRNWDKLGELMNENFNLRRSISHIHEKNLEMVELARSVGASAKFTGSGGAIIGTYNDDRMFDALSTKFESHQITILKPEIIDHK